jgi:two-component system, sensor histidine kinase PdtaS
MPGGPSAPLAASSGRASTHRRCTSGKPPLLARNGLFEILTKFWQPLCQFCISIAYPAKVAQFCYCLAGDGVRFANLGVEVNLMVLAPTAHPEATALSLALAVVASSNAPLLLMDGSLKVIAASASFCRGFQISPASVHGKRLSELGQGEWGVPQLTSLLEGTASGAAEVHAYEFDLKRNGQAPRLLVLNAHKLDYDDKEQVRLLVALADVTDSRASEKLKDNLLREKAILLQEVQHRVANSLQIIASILMQSARKVQSDETRGHLHDAHSRLMSIAAVQKHLAASRLGDVELRPYLVQLCKSLGASMIHDPKLLSIEVIVDDSMTHADISVSLGLIVTELVINALKHAFPGHRAGKIVVEYRSSDRTWTLSVTDNGIGMPSGSDKSKPGLGTNIVEALAKRLDAGVEVSRANPGTVVSIVHAPAAVEVELHAPLAVTRQ